MIKLRKLQKIFKISALVFGLFCSYQIFDSYKISHSSSPFILAAEQLELKSPIQQTALLEILYLTGHLNAEKLSQDINIIGQVDNTGSVIWSIHQALNQAKANQNDPSKFNSKYLAKTLFRGMKVSDVLDLILYETQFAFNRKSGQERSYYNEQNFMKDIHEEYINAARNLGLIDRVNPLRDEYTVAWIAGASRPSFLIRMKDFREILDTKKINIGKILILAGNRELWANIDGIKLESVEDNILVKNSLSKILNPKSSVELNLDSDKKQEGVVYLNLLAKLNNIELNPNNPFIQCFEGECPAGRFSGRIYANYKFEGSAKLTETLMAKQIKDEVFPDYEITILDTQAPIGQRPTTESTAKDAAEILVKGIINGEYPNIFEFQVLLYSNNPFIERQTLVAQQAINQVLLLHGLDQYDYKIIVEGGGPESKQNLVSVHSEFAGLIAEKWKAAQENLVTTKKFKRDSKDLFFQTRTHHPENSGKLENLEINIFLKIKSQLIDIFDQI